MTPIRRKQVSAKMGPRNASASKEGKPEKTAGLSNRIEALRTEIFAAGMNARLRAERERAIEDERADEKSKQLKTNTRTRLATIPKAKKELERLIQIRRKINRRIVERDALNKKFHSQGGERNPTNKPLRASLAILGIEIKQMESALSTLHAALNLSLMRRGAAGVKRTEIEKEARLNSRKK